MDLSDYIEITALMARYTRLVDQAEYADLGNMFAAGRITANRGGEPLIGSQAIADFYSRTNRSYAGRGAATIHQVTNIEFERLDGDEAVVRSCFVVLQATDALPLQPIVAGRYRDLFKRDGGSWSYAEKHIEVVLVGNVSSHLNIAL